MANEFNNSVTDFLKHLHEFIDWTNRWGAAHTPREETAFFEMQCKILEKKVPLKPFVHRLRLALESFLDDFRKEPHGLDRIGHDFVRKAKAIIEMIEPCKANFSEEDQSLVVELKAMLNTVIKQVESHTEA